MNGDSTLRVAIVGGGIGGLAAAAFLGRAGVADVTVFEQAPQLGEVGAGIQVAPNVARLLHRIGLASALDAIGTRLEVGWEMRRWQNGRVLSSMPLGAPCEARFGAPYHVVHRTGLIDALSSVLADGTVQTGHRCVAVRAAGEEVELTFDGGEQARADVVIGADGIHSPVRGVVAPPMPPRFSGLAAYRSIVPAAAAPALAKRPVFTSWLGPAPPPPGPGASRDEWRAWRRQQRDHWSGGWYGPWAWGGGVWPWFWGAALILIGGYYLLQNLGLLSWLRGDVLWPALLILLGVVILVGRRRDWRR